MKKIELSQKNNIKRSFKIQNVVFDYILELQKQINILKAENIVNFNNLKERQKNKFNNFSKFVFSEVVKTENLGNSKQITFKNGLKIRYNKKTCDNFHYAK
ncbi:MAG: hypothetical protein ACI4PF_04435 [Christensenellales bacterium]